MITLLPIILFLLPLLYIYGLVKRGKSTVLFAGLEHVIEKTAVRGKFFEEKGFKSFYYSFETTGNRTPAVKSKQVFKAHEFISIDNIKFLLVLLNINPAYLEIYFEGTGLNQLFYALYARIIGTFVISIFRGGEFFYYKKGKINIENLRMYLCLLTTTLSQKVFYRELYMMNHFNRLKFNKDKLYFDHNRVHVRKKIVFQRERKNILFLNSIKSFRRIELLLESIPKVIKIYPTVEVDVVGCRNDLEFQYVSSLINKFSIKNNVQVHYWSNSPQLFYEKASIFVLPADLIYCNFSLLEAMERGIPAIVSDVRDADKIIKQGVNGFLVKQNAEEIAKHIAILLEDEKLRIQMGREARKTILEEFDDKERMNPIYNFLLQKFSHLPAKL